LRKNFCRRLDRLAEFGARREWDARLDFAGCRIEDIAEPAAGTGNMLAADEMGQGFHG
jgi:hypothetical protein